ncbi:cache and HAMP domain-containing protein [Candidatus Bathyarchaeota archaeon]|nr:cache and HAMP domain-containing protein [Candidatus Bathyarchaeota archaeon]
MKVKTLVMVGLTVLMSVGLIITSAGSLILQGSIAQISRESQEQATESIRVQAGERIQGTSVEVLSLLEAEIDKQIDAITGWARAPLIVNSAVSAADCSREELFDAWSNPSTRVYDGEGYASADGDPYNDMDSSTSLYLHNLVGGTKGKVAEAFFTDARGYVVGSTTATSDFDQGSDDWCFQLDSEGTERWVKKSPNILGEEWWAEAKNSMNGLYLGDIEYDESAGVWGMDVCVLIKDSTWGTKLGVVKTVLRVDKVFEGVADLDARNVDEIKIVDDDGVILFTTGSQGAVMDEGHSVASMASFTQAVEGNSGYTIENDVDNNPCLVGYAYNRGNDWVCLTSSLKTNAFSLADQLEAELTILNARMVQTVNTRILLLIGGELLIASAVLGVFISLLNKKLTKPIVDMAEVMQEVAGGNLNAAVVVEGENEISDLGRSLNQMIMGLRLTAADLDMDAGGD